MDDNILDILCDYSLRGKEVDYKFLKYVFMTLVKDNEDYVKHIKQREFTRKTQKEGVHTPMAYSYFAKTIYTHPKEIKGIRDLLYSKTKESNWSDLCWIFLYNTYILFDLVHEFEHVDQFDKILSPDSSVESILLGLTHFAYVQINKESLLSKFLINKWQLFLDNNLFDLYYRMGSFNRAFGSDILYERLADIYACEKINKLLERVDADIDEVRTFFEVDLVQYLVTGYDENDVVPFPTVRYIVALKSLGIPEVNEYISSVVIPSLAEVKGTYERFKYGLYVKDEELKDLRKILS